MANVSRVIPSNMKPTWSCKIGNTVYEYTSGTTQSVPESVAEIIDKYYALQPKEANPTPTKYSDLVPASVDALGGVYQVSAIDDITSAPDADDYNALLSALRTAGILAQSEDDGE